MSGITVTSPSSASVLASVSYTYDADGRVVAVRTPNATALYSYDALGQLSQLQNLTPDGNPDSFAPGAQQVVDPYNGTLHTILSSFGNFTYDELENLRSMQFVAETQVGGGSTASTFQTGATQWVYDPAGRLTSESWSGGFGSPVTLSYGYDQADKATTMRGVSCSVDTESDLLTAISSLTAYANLTFDTSGERTRWGAQNAMVDVAGQIVYASGTSNSGGLGTVDQIMGYDDAGLRVWDQTQSNPLSNSLCTVLYTYDGSALVHRNVPGAVQASDGTVSAYGNDLSFATTYAHDVFNLWGPTGLVMEFDLDPSGNSFSRTFTYDPSGNCIGMSNGRMTTYAIGNNGNSSASQLTFFDAYGQPVWITPTGSLPRQAALQAVVQPFQYKGQFGCLTDWHTGLVYCQHRYYDPVAGRWLSRDPAGLEGGVNEYEYCDSNPVMSVDTDGLEVRDLSSNETTLLKRALFFLKSCSFHKKEYGIYAASIEDAFARGKVKVDTDLQDSSVWNYGTLKINPGMFIFSSTSTPNLRRKKDQYSGVGAWTADLVWLSSILLHEADHLAHFEHISTPPLLFNGRRIEERAWGLQVRFLRWVYKTHAHKDNWSGFYSSFRDALYDHILDANTNWISYGGHSSMPVGGFPDR